MKNVIKINYFSIIWIQFYINFFFLSSIILSLILIIIVSIISFNFALFSIIILFVTYIIYLSISTCRNKKRLAEINKKLAKEKGCSFLADEKLSAHGFFGTGGKAKYFVLPSNENCLVKTLLFWYKKQGLFYFLKKSTIFY